MFGIDSCIFHKRVSGTVNVVIAFFFVDHINDFICFISSMIIAAIDDIKITALQGQNASRKNQKQTPENPLPQKKYLI